jgi:hypothetical protein
MRRLLLASAAAAMISGQAAAFEDSTASVAMLYLSFPLGAPTEEDAAPRLGLRLENEYEVTFDDGISRTPYGTLEWRFDTDGQPVLYLNGVNLREISQRLHATDDATASGTADQTAAAVLAVVLATGVAVGIGLLLAAATEDQFEDELHDEFGP